MPTTFTWNITHIKCVPSYNGNQNIIYDVIWECIAECDGYKAKSYGSTPIPYVEGAFTPYEQLTKEQVLSWIWATDTTKEGVEMGVQDQLNRVMNPPPPPPKLPWE